MQRRIYEAYSALLELSYPEYYRYTSVKYQKSKFQINYLERIFTMTSFPSTDTRREIGYALRMPERSIQVWFQNRRQRNRHDKLMLVDECNIITPVDLIAILIDELEKTRLEEKLQQEKKEEDEKRKKLIK